MAKTVVNKDHLEILQNFVKGKIQDFENSKLMCIEVDARSLEQIEKDL